jgi:hypothetical protein
MMDQMMDKMSDTKWPSANQYSITTGGISSLGAAVGGMIALT